MRRIVWISVLAQIGIPALPAQEKGKTAVVEGTVVNSITGAGIEGATVLLNAPHQYQATTDAKGVFQINAVDPGDYRVIAAKIGFTAQSPVSFLGRGSFVQARAGDVVEERLELIPPSTIHGRVIGADGNPAANVDVSLGPPFATKTREDGTFAFENVPAGQHILMALGKPAPTYFPAAVDPAQAQLIGLAPGADQGGYEIRLQTAVVHRVRGVALDDSGKPVPKALIRLSPALLNSDQSTFFVTTGGVTEFAIRPGSVGVQGEKENPVTAEADGSFELPAVREGAWALHVEGDGMHQDMPISVQHDIDDLRVRLEAEFELHGRVTLSDGSAPPGDPMVMMRLVAVDGSTHYNHMAPSEKGGLLNMGAMTSGRYRVEASVVGRPYYVSSIVAGAVDAMNQAVLLTPATGDVRVIVRAGGAIRGTVEKCNGGSVLLVPPSMAAGDLVRLSACNRDNSFEFDGLPPGDYYAAAVSDFNYQTMASEESVRGIMRDAVSVHLDDGAAATVQLKVQ